MGCSPERWADGDDVDELTSVEEEEASLQSSKFSHTLTVSSQGTQDRY